MSVNKETFHVYMTLKQAVNGQFSHAGATVELIFCEPLGNCWIEATYRAAKKVKLRSAEDVLELEAIINRFLAMASKKVYSFKASGGGCRVNGRILADNMNDATNQAFKAVEGYPAMNVNISELSNQRLALKQWIENKLGPR